jgi:hypothetical protein
MQIAGPLMLLKYLEQLVLSPLFGVAFFCFWVIYCQIAMVRNMASEIDTCEIQ